MLFALFLAWGISQAASEKVLVTLTVPEQFPKISGSLISFSTADRLYEYAQVPFITKFQNTGGVALKPVGKIIIKNQYAKTVAAIAVNDYGLKVAPGATQDYFNQWNRQDSWGLGLGWYSANLALNYGTDETFNANVKFLIFPWRATMFTLIYLLLVFIINNIFWQTQLQTSNKLNFKPHR